MNSEISTPGESKEDFRNLKLQLTNAESNIMAKSDISLSKTVYPGLNTIDIDEKETKPSIIKNEVQDDQEMDNYKTEGGRLTFFKEGKPLLELSHRTEQGSWVQVKSKTYWPPSTTAKTTNQLKNGSSVWSASDGCSSNSIALNDHTRKQVMPKRLMLQANNFYWFSTKFKNGHRSKPRRNPFIVFHSNDCSMHQNSIKMKKSVLKEKLCVMWKKLGCNIDNSVSLHAIFDNWKSSDNEKIIKLQRRKLLKYINGDKEAHPKKKPYSGIYSHKICDRAAGSSLQITHKRMPYSIDSLLNKDSSNENESFLKHLLKADVKESPSSLSNYSGHEPLKNFSNKNLYEVQTDNDERTLKNTTPEYNNSIPNIAPSIGNFYLNPYLNHGYMVMPPFYSTAEHTPDMASMVAAAINLQGIQNSPILPSSSLESSYRTINLSSPQPKLSSHSSQSPQSKPINCSPNSHQLQMLNHVSLNSPQPRTSSRISPQISPSPNSKHQFNSNQGNVSYINLMNSPPSPWIHSISNSPPNQPGSAVSPLPQDVPLNLSKRKEKG